SITLLATLAMFARNLILLGIFAPAGLRWALPPLLAMAALAAVLIWRWHRSTAPAGTELKLASPISMRRVAEFGLVFLAIQVATALGQRHWGHAGTYVIAVAGGIFNSAGATVASAVANAPVMSRVLRQSKLGWTNEILAWALAGAGAVVLVLQHVRP